VRASMPKATSLQLTVSVTTKAGALAARTGRGARLRSIALPLQFEESLELGVILQKTVDEVGAALNVASCSLRVEGANNDQALTYSYCNEASRRRRPKVARRTRSTLRVPGRAPGSHHSRMMILKQVWSSFPSLWRRSYFTSA